jgi:LAO/AO transport system kinase
MKDETLAALVLKGDRRALARAISLVESGADATGLMDGISGRIGSAFVLGVTGPPGTGKSTLVDRMVADLRAMKLRVGVIAVDPTSPISGGALLGDRVRMTQHTLDRGVFIRSMASRGWSGGLSGAVSEAILILGAAGMDIIIVETVGIGQSDIEIMKIAHAVIVVTMPGLGDDVQASKAGLMEIGDVYAVNKSDLPGADAMVIDLLSMARDMKGRSPPVLQVSALKGDGMDRFMETVEALRAKFTELAKKKLLGRLEGRASAESLQLAKRVSRRELSFDQAAAILAESQLKYRGATGH